MERIINAIDEKIIWKKEWEKVKRKEKIHFLGRNGGRGMVYDREHHSKFSFNGNKKRMILR